MKTIFFTILIIFALSLSAKAETYCQLINSKGRVDNTGPLVEAMNQLLKIKGAKHRTNAKEMTNIMLSFCKSNPNANIDDATNHLDILAEMTKSYE